MTPKVDEEASPQTGSDPAGAGDASDDLSTTGSSSQRPPASVKAMAAHVPRQPMPIAANLLRSPRSIHPVGLQHLPVAPETPGPGAFESHLGGALGAARQVRQMMPKQLRHHSRAHAILPLAPITRTRAGAPRSISSQATSVAFSMRSASIGPPVAKPPFIKHDEYGVTEPMTEEEFEEMMRKDSAKQEQARRDARRVKAADLDEPDMPKGLSKEDKLLWRSFVGADINGDRKLSKREMFDALERKALDREVVRQIILDYRNQDTDMNGFLEWEEFHALAQSFPEMGDIMREELG